MKIENRQADALAAGVLTAKNTAAGSQAAQTCAGRQRADMTAGERGVALEISDAARQQLQDMLRTLQGQQESDSRSEDDMEEMSKALEIARRIARGDHVPALDEKKLMEYSMKLYLIAKQSAVLNAGKKHKDWDSLYDDEEGKRNADGTENGGTENGGTENGGTEAVAAGSGVSSSAAVPADCAGTTTDGSDAASDPS